MGEAHQEMHRPWPANPFCFDSAKGAETGKQSAAPKKTPPRRVGNPFASNGGPHQSANETIALGSGKVCFDVKRERPG